MKTKRTIATTFLGLMAGSLLFAQPVINSVPTAQSTPNPNAAEIAFEKDGYDYGVIKQGSPGAYIFKFKNTGKEPLIITAASASCGCTVPEAPLNKPFKPGESGTITVSYNTNIVGAFAKSVTITSNAKTSSKIITIKGKVEATPAEEPFPTKKSNGPIENQN